MYEQWNELHERKRTCSLLEMFMLDLDLLYFQLWSSSGLRRPTSSSSPTWRTSSRSWARPRSGRRSGSRCCKSCRGTSPRTTFSSCLLWSVQTIAHFRGGGGPHGTMESVLALHPAAQGLIPGVPGDLFLLSFIVSALLREWTVQSLIVDRTHLVLVCGKLVLQKNCALSDFDPCS